MSIFYESQADGDFSRARTRQLIGRLQSLATGERHELLPLEEVLAILHPTGEAYGGIKAVPLELIIGSEGRYRDFDKHFLPRRDHLRSRWMKVDIAYYEDIQLPPVRLYEIGGVYFVRDGNHRVSVAKLRGQSLIDAEVTTLSTEIGLKPDMDLDSLTKALLAWEKRMFYMKTEYDLITGQEDLDFTTPGRYDTVYEHILVHKYFMNQNRESEIDFGEALLSWHDTVYTPVVETIRENGLLSSFPGRTYSDLYVFISAHWHTLKTNFGVDDLKEAARDFRKKYGYGIVHQVGSLTESLVTRLMGFLGGQQDPEQSAEAHQEDPESSELDLKD